ncbi:beta-propeller fold lactonase family protein [uncultured Imperialibacter sp.]|uniref:beta-propeller fold lactonase family protein n=1 Tax=uncultured Imperialibacter sp. TaxID=1672639 RepID=UPI0030DC10AE|tara:strand:- start:1060 stop:2547 length:1488 start_codon:yes stop_codon:yes gene_type:complete
MKKIAFVFLCCLTGVTFGKAQSTNQYFLFIGTYATEAGPNGIHTYLFDSETGTLRKVQPVTELGNASFLAVNNDQSNLYAVSGSKVNAYALNPGTGQLSFLNSVPSAGSCYVSAAPDGNAVFVGNYGGGNTEAVRTNADGSFDEASVQLLQHQGSSVNKERQEAPHVHATVLSLDGRYLMVPDLGTDRVYQYELSTTSGEILKPASQPWLSVPKGAGPRHLVFHPNGRYAYLVLELQGAVMALDYREGTLKEKQTISMVDKGFKGRLSGADIHVSPDGKFLYASNRGDANEIAIYSIDQKGKLTRIGRQPVMGKTPRNFAIDPTGRFLLVANQDTNEVIVFQRNQTTGLLTPTGESIPVDKPVCLKFAPVQQGPEEKLVAEAVERFRQTMTDPDSDVLASLVSDDLEYVHSSGTVRDKQGFIDEFVKRWTNFSKVDILNQTIKISGDNAIVRHRLVADANNPGYPSKVDIIILMVWRKEGGKWKMLARQAAKIPE